MTRASPKASRAQPRKPPERSQLAPRAWLALALGAIAAVVVIAVLAVRGGGEEEVDAAALGHARAACDITAKTAEATRVDTAERYAAAAILLDRAIAESELAAKADARFAELDRALQRVHTAAHDGERAAWQATLDAALAACDSVR